MRGIVGLVLAGLAVVAVAAPAARGDDPPLVNWPALLPPLAQGFTPTTFDNCRDGDPSCIDRTLDEMRRRLRAHDAACSDNALFQRNYLLVTEAIEDLLYIDPPFYQDSRYLSHVDAVFAELYFRAEDDWRAGRVEKVPEAWRIAFAAADEQRVQGAGNLMLGINAHVQRDMPYLLAGIGLVDEHGRSRKPDHDKGNEVLNTAYDDVLAQAIAEDDPDLAFYELPGTKVDNLLLFQTIAGWREGVWRNAERLAAARSDAERRMVADSIEAWAASQAREIEAMFAYHPGFTRERRDALCAERRRRAAALERREQRSGAAACPAARARIVSARALRGRRLAVRGRARGCLGRVDVSIARRAGQRRCRFVGGDGRLGRARACRLRSWLPASGHERFRLRVVRSLPRGRYAVRARAVDAAGRAGRASAAKRLRLRR